MPDIIVTAWKCYGHDRGYATAADGTKLGWIDAKTAAVIIEDGADAVAVKSALEAWLAARVSDTSEPPILVSGANTPITSVVEDATPVAEPEPEPAPAPVPEPEPVAEVPWTDLAANRPGDGVRALAKEAWASDKAESKLFAYGARIFDVNTNERAWRKGAMGEEYVGEKLEPLRKRGWHLLHSVPVGKGDSDIDHIAIGPGGVFTINSKKHDGKKIWVAKYQMRVNGTPVPYLRNSRHEASRAKKLLEPHVDFEVPVMGCVVVLTGSIVPEVTYRDMPDDVRVLDKWDVPRWFKKRAGILTPDQVEALYEVARRSTTWKPVS
jgi:hypothetical protein